MAFKSKKEVKRENKEIGIISCIEAVTRMFDALERLLSAKGKKELDDHLAVCRHCCDRFEFEKLLQEKIAEASRSAQIPKQLQTRIRKLLDSF